MPGIISGLISMFGWGTSDFLAAKSSRKIGYLLTLFWMQIAGFLIASFYFFLHFSFPFNNIVKYLPALIIGGFLNAIGYIAFYKGLKEARVSLVSPIGGSWAVITVILSSVFLGEVLSTNRILFIALIFIGLMLVSTNIKKILEIKKLTIFDGVKEGFVAMFCWGIAMFLIINPSRLLSWFLPIFVFRFFSILFLLFFIFINKQSLRISYNLDLFGPVLLIGLFDVGAFFTYSFGIIGAYASFIAPIAASFPLVTIILSRIFLKEKLDISQIFGIIITISGLILISIK